jgi:dTDP-4-dehydrorhamnose reductase
MRIFLTGESGILGTDIATRLKQAGYAYTGFNSANIDIGNPNEVSYKIAQYRPDTVIHCAAMTDVDSCEDKKEEAYRVNVTGTYNLARSASEIGAKMVYISSCGVYGSGKSSPYLENDPTAPVNYHHFTKLEGEKCVKEQNDQYLIIRPGWLFGGSLQHKKNFVEARRKEAASSALIKSAYDKTGSPTYTADLAAQIIDLLEQDQTGTFNVVNEGCASRFDYVAEIIRLFKYDTKIAAVNSNEFPRRAIMPGNECLENYNLNAGHLNKMRSWKEALASYITSNYHS